MRRVCAVVTLILGSGLLGEPAVAAKPQFGVFATINGKKFKAVSSGRADDLCVFGFYEASGGVIFTAGECRGRRHRVPRRNYKLLVFVCGVVNPPPRTPPFDAPCLTAGYTEARTKRGVPISMKQWTSSTSFELGPDGMTIEHSAVNVHIESFDGTYVRGTFSGVFDMPQQPGNPVQVPINGEGTFYFPVRGVQ